MLNSRDIGLLEPPFKKLIVRWLEACKNIGLDVLVISTYRDDEYQNWLYAKGRTSKGVIVTNARGGESLHNQKLALDFCIMDGKTCDWTNKTDFTRAGILAESLGIFWAGRWQGKLKELGHIQFKK